MSFRTCAFVCLSILAAVHATAQPSTQPALSKPLPPVAAAAGTATATVDLREYFTTASTPGQVAQFSIGSSAFNVELLPGDAPRSVANFVDYVNRGAFTNSIIHRSDKSLGVIQGGLAAIDATGLVAIPTTTPVPLEYKLPNIRGTIAMARTGDPNSATSQWFFNLVDNTTTLGPANGGGYAVFGRVMGSGMNVVDAIGALQVVNAGSPLNQLPVQGYSSGDILFSNLVVVSSIRMVPVFPDAGSVGSIVRFTATSSNGAVASATVAASGLTITPLSPGSTTITVRATDTDGKFAEGTMTVTVTATAPGIALQPAGAIVDAGSTVALTVGATGAPLTYQWRKDGTNLAGATNETLILENITAVQAGIYSVVVNNEAGSVTSGGAPVALVRGVTSQISNLSVRTNLDAGQTLVVGFVTTGPKPLLARAIGPGLVPLGITSGFYSDPRIELRNQATGATVAGNDDWNAGLQATFDSVGAFPLSTGSKDAALVFSVDGPHTAQVTGTGSGIMLVEVYDTSTGGSARLNNVSARNRVGTGSTALVAGFVIDGSASKTVLIRGIGPALSDVFGVSGVLADPKLEIFRQADGVKIVENDNWKPILAPYFDAVGAYRFFFNSKDAALLVTLPPGAYTAQVSGVGGTTGDGVVEVYEVL
jgi:cyclophilin family peptidyl-prolyl cis-trans isomerase